MSELNERDLSQVSGGASQWDGQEDEWRKRNCKVCPKQPQGCSLNKEMIARGRLRRAKGEDDECIELKNLRRTGGV